MTGSGSRISRLQERLAAGEVVVMDGGSGTELQAMGVPMDRAAWSGVANRTHPETVKEMHAAYLAAGAEILITNTFAAGPGSLDAAAGRFEEANRNAVAAAAAARAEAGGEDVIVAGSMSRMVAGACPPQTTRTPSLRPKACSSMRTGARPRFSQASTLSRSR